MHRIYLAALGTILTCTSSAASADELASGPPRAVSLMHYIHATQNVDTTTAFYRDVFGLETPPVRPYEGPGAARLNNAPGLVLRLSRPILPGEKYGFEFTEFTHVDRKGGQQALPTDPGAVELILYVRDLDPVYAAVKKHGAPILSHGGGPVKIETSMGPAHALLIRDPDGYLVRTIEVPASKATLPGNIQAGTSLGVAVKDLNATVEFYKDVLGFEVTADESFGSNPAMADLVGAPSGSEYRSASATFPGEGNARIEFYEWKGMKRTPFSLRVPDPGAGGMVMGVRNLDAIVEKVKARGLPTVTPSPIWFTSTIRDIFVKDLDGLNLELYEQVPKAAAK
jgi:catechol 2,3-dioxygenase-like lactoylglutathione lyase family enzyme